jgi:hypothetical protein
MNKKELLNEVVLKGILPLAFLNAEVIEKSINDNKFKNEVTFIINKKYHQYNLPPPCSPILLSKLYEIY